MNILYYNPLKPSFSSREELKAAALKRGHPIGKIEDWLLRQDAYTLHKRTRKKFPRNPYTVNVGDLWELDLADMGTMASHDGHRYLLNVIDAFSKHAYSVPIRSKTSEAVASAFPSILAKIGNSSKPLAVRTRARSL